MTMCPAGVAPRPYGANVPGGKISAVVVAETAARRAYPTARRTKRDIAARAPARHGGSARGQDGRGDERGGGHARDVQRRARPGGDGPGRAAALSLTLLLRRLLDRNADLALEDLPGRPLRQLVDEEHLPGVLVGGDLLLAVVAQLLGGGLVTLLQGHDGDHLLAELGVRHPDHRRLGDRGMLVEDLLDLARIDVVAGADDHVLLAVDDEEVPVLVDLRQVAAVEPAVADRLARGIGPVPIALHHVVPADDDLADLAAMHLVVLLVDDLHLDALDRGTDRARLALAVGVVEGSHRRRLAEAVALEDLAAELVLEGPHDLDRHRGATRAAQAQGRRVGAVGAGAAQHRRVHRRYP